ncbi:hypothetical protein ASE03_29270 [Kitasatospora sp. Root187]|nr:hypothetical protein ASC99_30550 [Kitasatospora sp. Root107]KRB68049.1 hypothetical protein ASE03_29270 [Kitasatospora sp. Root187]
MGLRRAAPGLEATDGLDGRVSIEVDPRFARDTAATIAEARALWWAVDRPNLFVKIPATLEGLEAISAALGEGISINVTLIFSLARYAQVVNAFLDGMERARAAGRDLSAIANARLAYQHHEGVCASDRWSALAAAGARPQRPLWASTGVKDRPIRGDTIHGTYAASRQVLDDLAAVGISYDDVVQALEEEGIAKFTTSWHELYGRLEAELQGKHSHSAR